MRSLKDFLKATKHPLPEVKISLDHHTPTTSPALWSWKLRPFWQKLVAIRQLDKRIYLGLLLILIALFIWTGWLGRLWDSAGKMAGDFSARQGFGLQSIQVKGRVHSSANSLLEASQLKDGMPLLAIDLWRVKENLEKLPWIKSAIVERRFPDTIYLQIEEKTPVAIWQYQGKFSLIDGEGSIIPVNDVRQFSQLMVVVGENAPKQTPNLIKILASQPDLQERVTAAVWVGNRRWDLRIDNRVEIILPEENPAEAWAFLAKLQQEQKILNQQVKRIDLRIPGRLTMSALGEIFSTSPAVRGL